MDDYKKTLNLPKTKFSMKGNLVEKEPKILKNWNDNQLYKLIRKKKERKKIFFLHDGPPYANGNIHIGHAINKILKDIIIKSKNMSGFDAPYIPSWDCHGLPIEQKVENKNDIHLKKISTLTFQKKCREYAQKQVNKQKKDFIRLGVIGDWENSHLTMNFKNEADIIRTLSEIIKKKYVYQDFKPIYWCIECSSSLSEAEIEYFKKKSDSIIVAFTSKDPLGIKKLFDCSLLNNKNIYLPIWTTTPWTLPSSKAISIHPHIQYQLIETKQYYIIIAKELVQNILDTLKIKKWKIVNSIKGSILENKIFLHPFLKDINIPVILGKHVSCESGTGAVHTAPDHGIDDYIVSQKYNIRTSNLVDFQGKYITNIHEKLDHINVLQANPVIIKLLKKNNSLLHHESLIHSYPHCWRHKTPIIFRATPQWFINIDKNQLRNTLLKEIKKVEWIPNWGESRIKDMIQKRPHWCISRQRQWGVPMSLFIHKEKKTLHPNTYNLMQKIAKKVESEGIQSWININPKELLGIDYYLYDKIPDILDVWFDSGNTYTSITYKNKKYNIINQADMYLEGSDQHRGWFMSSLIISTLIKKQAPYSTVLTHGFAVDGNGQKMSKSVDNAISPNTVVNTLGADVLRLWVASSNYSNDISISNEILKNSSDMYRRIRNTARFILANITDFNPKTDLISKDNMILLDKWAIGQTLIVQKEIINFYHNYNFHGVVQRLMYFCSIEMGSFYLDIIKDRQYTLQKNSKARRSCQTAMYYIIHSLVRWIAPILSFTAHEIWSYIPETDSQYVFTEEWFDKLFYLKKDDIFNYGFWNDIFKLKNEINKFIEDKIKNKIINNSLEAAIILYVSNSYLEKLKILGEEIKFIFLTSSVEIKRYDTAPLNITKNQNIDQLKIDLYKIQGEKCPRCWHYFSFSENNIKNSNICHRCILNTMGNGEERIFI
ncbi:isoleucine--tRNA ligase [Buchnera aphidicola (Macrosiphoniella sanborni)]|uniref:Isoleucine--tRNA ligase n=1 Tax=Buchnera aphidicola (Macrosiphoniella sanborni) TaxID=1241865 RepID=A0A4D6YCK4_9GAMM|nr:isoleucine--tRNA ligase [Buchnera aphidicola]QCI23704.1 isoleucine--tRNA ligase [Buchnera aphidicola (Macrosiphoniella sanborni)]